MCRTCNQHISNKKSRLSLQQQHQLNATYTFSLYHLIRAKLAYKLVMVGDFGHDE